MAKISDLGIPCDTYPKGGEDTSGTHHAKFHANWCHHCRDICNQTQEKAPNLVRCHTPYGGIGG